MKDTREIERLLDKIIDTTPRVQKWDYGMKDGDTEGPHAVIARQIKVLLAQPPRDGLERYAVRLDLEDDHETGKPQIVATITTDLSGDDSRTLLREMAARFTSGPNTPEVVFTLWHVEQLDALAPTGTPTEPATCRACRQVGAIHCAHPEDCGQIEEPAVEDAGEFVDLLRNKASALASAGCAHSEECGFYSRAADLIESLKAKEGKP